MIGTTTSSYLSTKSILANAAASQYGYDSGTNSLSFLFEFCNCIMIQVANDSYILTICARSKVAQTFADAMFFNHFTKVNRAKVIQDTMWENMSSSYKLVFMISLPPLSSVLIYALFENSSTNLARLPLITWLSKNPT